jgi:hypothetical protein
MIATVRPRGGHRIVNDRPQRTGHDAERDQAALEAARRADAAERPHPETEIERAGMNKQSFEHVLVPAHVRSPEPARLVEMRTRSLEQFAASAEEPLAAVSPDAASIRIDCVPFGCLVRPRLEAAIRFADVGTNLERLEIVHGGATVVALVRNHLLDRRDRIIGEAATASSCSATSGSVC